MKQLLKKLLIAVLIFIVVTALYLVTLNQFPNMNDTQFYISVAIYLVLSQIGFAIDYSTK